MRLMTEEESRKLKNIELDILLEVQHVCEELGIQFFLDSGTLLGAARHNGFIPWDDDIDIGMLRDDYNRFLSEAPKILKKSYWLQNPYNESDATVSFAKVRRVDTLLLENANKGNAGNQGIWIDIFPFDVVDGSRESLLKQKKKWRFWHKLFTLRAVGRGSRQMGLVPRIARFSIHAVLSLAPKEFYLRALDSIAFEPSQREEGVITSFHYFNAFLELPFNKAFPLTVLPFEGHEMPVFNNWEMYLEQIYGNWKQLPPVELRAGHEIVEIDLGPDE